jgi:aldehyde dehydrogenase (NAD+)
VVHRDRVEEFLATAGLIGMVSYGNPFDPATTAAPLVFVHPTLFTDVINEHVHCQGRDFGPVLSVIPFTEEGEAVRIANETEYGLSATVWTSDVLRAMRLTKAIRAGTIGISGFQIEPHAAFGGHRQSRPGCEGSRAAIEAYTELRTVMLPLTDEMM